MMARNYQRSNPLAGILITCHSLLELYWITFALLCIDVGPSCKFEILQEGLLTPLSGFSGIYLNS